VRRAAAAVLAALATAQCAFAPQPREAFSFAVMGDVPYTQREETRFLDMMRRIDAEPLAFAVHVGDIKGTGACSDEFYLRRRAQFDRSAHPFFFTPGDNEWRDCRDPRNGGMSPVERLARLREIFFADRSTFGRRRLAAEAQERCVEPALAGCGCAYAENRTWALGPVRFVTLNVPGVHFDDFDAALRAEARCREDANRQWLDAAFDAADAPSVKALVVFIQANPWDVQRAFFRPLVDQLATRSARLAKPVLLAHGDTHTYRVDDPIAEIEGRAGVPLTRLETFGSPFVGWVKVTVDPSRPDPFRFEPRLEAIVLPD
jgi:hypothetical protein